MHVYEHMIMWVYDLMTEILQILSVVLGSLLHTAFKTVQFHLLSTREHCWEIIVLG